MNISDQSESGDQIPKVPDRWDLNESFTLQTSSVGRRGAYIHTQRNSFSQIEAVVGNPLFIHHPLMQAMRLGKNAFLNLLYSLRMLYGAGFFFHIPLS
jgi:hypothetical protein